MYQKYRPMLEVSRPIRDFERALLILHIIHHHHLGQKMSTAECRHPPKECYNNLFCVTRIQRIPRIFTWPSVYHAGGLPTLGVAIQSVCNVPCLLPLKFANSLGYITYSGSPWISLLVIWSLSETPSIILPIALWVTFSLMRPIVNDPISSPAIHTDQKTFVLRHYDISYYINAN